MEERIDELRGLINELKNSKTVLDIYNNCEEYNFEIDVDYTDCSFEEIKEDLISLIKCEIKTIEEQIEDDKEAEKTSKEIQQKGLNNYYSDLYGIPRN